MDMGIAGKVAFVAGGSKGMGRASAEMLAAERCKVAIVARTPSYIEETVDVLRAAGGTAIGISAHLSDRDDVNRAVAEVTEKLGAPDIVVGQNSNFALGTLDDISDEEFEQAFRDLTMSQIYLARATIPEMRRRKWGRFIHIGSQAAKEPRYEHPHMAANTIRPSAIAFLHSLARYVAPDGVTINYIGPGLIKTPTLQWYIANEMKISPEEADAWLAGEDVEGIKGGQGPAAIPMKRAGRAEEIAATVTFLASELAAYITGAYIGVDGGRHAYVM